MEYFVGAAITMLAYTLANIMFRKELREASDESKFNIKYSQSHVYEMMAPFLDFIRPDAVDTDRQSFKYLKNAYMKIMVVQNKAYWIKDNIFYVSDIVDGEIQKETQRAVDTMNMDKVELDEMMFIVEKLREDEDDDRRGSGQ